MLPLVARSGDGAFRRNSRLRLPPSGPAAFSSEVNSSLLGPVLDDGDGDGGDGALSTSGLGLLTALLRRLFMSAPSNPVPSPPSIRPESEGEGAKARRMWEKPLAFRPNSWTGSIHRAWIGDPELEEDEP
jgi:hypothetical protein